MAETAREMVRRILEDEFGAPQDAADEASLREELGLDSLDLVEMTMAIEEEAGFDIDDEDAEAWRTLGDVVRYVERAVGEIDGDGDALGAAG